MVLTSLLELVLDHVRDERSLDALGIRKVRNEIERPFGKDVDVTIEHVIVHREIRVSFFFFFLSFTSFFFFFF